MTNWGHLWNLTHGRYLNIRDLGHVSEMRELQFSSVLLSSLTTRGKLTDSKLETLDAFTQASVSQLITSLEGPPPARATTAFITDIPPPQALWLP